MSSTNRYVLVTANPDAEDCLKEANERYIEEHPELLGWDLRPRFELLTDRRYIELTVPAWHLLPKPEAIDPDAQCPEHGCARHTCDDEH